MTVSPGTVPPGGTITVTVTGGCREGSDINIAGPGSTTRPDVVSKLGPGGRGAVTVPRTGRSGTWSVWVFCEDDLTPRTAFVVSPAGRPATGDGATAGGPDPGLVTAGGGALALAAAGGLLLLRRRRTA
ncbi:hypothetical protein PT931_30290 [Longispora urticae]